jgi:formamidopyrimidine-DNA glycosylase
MPELPDITVYVERLRAFAEGSRLQRIRLGNPFVLRTVEPSPASIAGRKLESVSRIGKRIVLGFEGESYAVIHLMVAGRLRWQKPGAALARKSGLAAFDFDRGSRALTEAGSKHRASLHLLSERADLAQFDRGGIDVLGASPEAFAAALRRKNRTLKRALTDPAIVDGVGNAYSDEILHRARMSPFRLTHEMSDLDFERLQGAAVGVLTEWIDRLRSEVGEKFPEKVTAFRSEMAVHGKFGLPCPQCGAPVQRIIYAENEANYCPGCQTGGKMFADRSLSRLLKKDWPRTLDELEELNERRRAGI